MKFIFGITSPHPDAFYTLHVKSLDFIKILPALSDYHPHLAGGQVWIAWTAEVSEILFWTSETILVPVWLDWWKFFFFWQTRLVDLFAWPSGCQPEVQMD